MAKDEKTSKRIATIAAKGLKTPERLTKAEIKALAASALTQAPDKKKPSAKPTAKKSAAKKAPAKKKAKTKKK